MTSGFTEENVSNQSGKTIVVTGANTGLGYEAARVLAGRGARVLIACRSNEKAAAAKARILKLHPGADIETVQLDLGNLASVREAAARVRQENRLDILINNAGIMIPPRELTADGFESQFGVNHFGPFAFTGLLLDKLAETKKARVVSTSSLAHRQGEIDFDDIAAERTYSAMERYRMSKLANMLFAFELDRRLKKAGRDTISVACHPGVADTELSRYFPKAFFLIAPFVRPFFNTPAQGAWPTLMAATAAGAHGGDYFGPAKRGETAGPAKLVEPAPQAHDEAAARRLWDVSIEMTGVDPGI